ncbi:VanZ family protein [Cellulomonas sp. S1-8]|uniref:VanZ family protein n=1 Tax=Cellulomonas sp. S1-8 TaxID=2904790 RepID=UPI002244C3A2|nr:VanZ family protein [Cellulomonas sp. S1-8]UZN03249.1 VanZ family protein [Cellulomonas sp. S1-8]
MHSPGLDQGQVRMSVWLEALWRQTPYLPAGMVVTSLVVALIALPLARRTRLPVTGVVVWLVALGVVASLTLTPRTALRPVTERVCALDSWAPLDLHSVLVLDQRAANVALLVPLALLCALPRDRRLLGAALGFAVALPFVVEGVQYALPGLARVCDSNDLVDNLLGVALGAATGLVVRAVSPPRPGSGRRDVPREDRPRHDVPHDPTPVGR